jgi:uncharacterized membrane protein YraQ (UPF0718 family)
MGRNAIIRIAAIGAYLLFLLFSALLGFSPGEKMLDNLTGFVMEMAKILPCAFILIGLFDVWVKRESVEKHLGLKSGLLGYIWAVLLSATTVGGVIVALPVAYSLFRKGARLGVVFTYIGSAAVCRIPMTIFEASFLGPKFTAVRFLVSLPLIMLSSVILGRFLEKRNFSMREEK